MLTAGVIAPNQPLERVLEAQVSALGDSLVLVGEAEQPQEVDSVLLNWRHPSRGKYDTKNLDKLRDQLDVVSQCNINHVVFISSACVYGARESNPVPLTERAPVEPDYSYRPATDLAIAENEVTKWASEQPQRSCVVLRPAPVVRRGPWWYRDISGPSMLDVEEAQRPLQFLHIADLASAVQLAMRDQLSGVYNVAPEGFIATDDARSAVGRPMGVKVSQSIADRARTTKQAVSESPAGGESYRNHPWVVAADTLRARGWHEEMTHVEALVAASQPIWGYVSPKRRQELTLGLAAAGIAAVAATSALAVRRAIRTAQGR